MTNVSSGHSPRHYNRPDINSAKMITLADCIDSNMYNIMAVFVSNDIKVEESMA